MSILIDCPECKRQLRVPDEFQGRSVRCPTCGKTFRAPEPAAPPRQDEPAGSSVPATPPPALDVALKLELDDPTPAPVPPAREPSRPTEEAPRRRSREPEDEDDWDRRRGRRRRRDFEPCPRCDEDVRRGAVVCPFCGLDLEEQGDGYTRQARVRRDAEPHRGGTVQGIGITSLVLAIFYILPISLPLGIAAWVMGRRDLHKMAEGEMDPNGRKKTKDGWLCGMVGTILTIVYSVVLLGIILVISLEEGQRAATNSRIASQPPARVNPQPAWAPPGNDFALRGPAGPTVIKRGQTKTITLTLDRAPNFRGHVTVSVDRVTLPEDFIVEPAEIELQGWQTTASFRITVTDDANLGDQVVRFVAEDDDVNEQPCTVIISVTR